jgi:hypothetical protein
VLAALRIFVDEVAKRHAGKAPILYGEHAFATTYGADTSLSSLAPLLWWNRWVTGTSSPRRNRW